MDNFKAYKLDGKIVVEIPIAELAEFYRSADLKIIDEDKMADFVVGCFNLFNTDGALDFSTFGEMLDEVAVEALDMGEDWLEDDTKIEDYSNDL
jgi:hypothetical protein